MVTTDLGACEWFVWDLRRSNLLDRGQLDQIVGEFLTRHPGAEPPALAEYLVQQNILTQFQAERLLQGKTQGFVLGPFTLMDSLGTGSMGTVYKSHNKNDNQWYAVKVLPRRSMWNVRIARRKVRVFEQCQHPNVVPFVDVGTAGGMHYLAWPLVEGETLDKIVQRQGPLDLAHAVGLAIQTAEGLDVCHAQGLFHGLMKPSNLLITPDGTVKILDFGIGSLLAETEGESLVDTMSTANSVNSGLDCASPESIMDPTNLTPTGDQYSLGCVLYFCLCGQYPFPDGTAVEKMMAHQHKQPKSLAELRPDLPTELVAVVERLMEKQPEMRFASCGDAAEALRPFAPQMARRQAPRTHTAMPIPPRPSAPPPPVHGGGSMGPGGAPSWSPAEAPMPSLSNLPPVYPQRGPAVNPRGAAPGLPSRQNLGPRQAPAPQPQHNYTPQVPLPPQPAPTPPHSYVSPENNQPAGSTWKDRLSTAFVAVCAVLATLTVWYLASRFLF